MRDAYRVILIKNIQIEKNESYNLEEPEQLNRLLDFLISFRDVVALDEDVVQEISVKLKTDAPEIICKPQYRLPQWYLTHIDKWVTESLNKGYIKHIKSGHSSPLLVVPKKKKSKRRL